MTSRPSVSVCIPTCNAGSFLQTALESVFQQTWRSLEVIVSDDGSCDGTFAEATRLLKESPFPYQVVQHLPSTPAENWNHCARLASAPFIKYLFQDDYLEPRCVETMMDLALQEPRIDLVFCERELLLDNEGDESGALLRLAQGIEGIHRPLQTLQRIQRGEELLGDPGLFAQLPNNFGEPTAALVSKPLLREAGGFDGSYRQLLDVDCWLRLLPRCYVGFVFERLCTFRVHSRQLSHANMSNGTSGREHARFFRGVLEGDLFSRLARPARERVYWHIRMSHLAWRERFSRRYLSYAARRLPGRFWQRLQGLLHSNRCSGEEACKERQ